MGNYVSTKYEIKNYICARTPLIIVDSSERERVERMLKEISNELDVGINYYTDEKQYSGKALHICFNESDMSELIAASDGFSYSDIEYVIKDAAQLALLKGQTVISKDLLLEKFREIIPISQTNPDKVAQIRKWGFERAVAASSKSGGIVE